MHFCISLSLFLCLSSSLPLLTLSSSIHAIFPLFPLSAATGLLAVCHHLTEHQVPLSGRLYIAKHQGMKTVQLSLSHTHISVCTCTLESQPSMNKSEAGPGSWLLEEIAEGTGNPQLNTGSHGVLMTSEWRELHSTTSTADAKKTQRPAKCKRSLEPKWVLKASWER